MRNTIWPVVAPAVVTAVQEQPADQLVVEAVVPQQLGQVELQGRLPVCGSDVRPLPWCRPWRAVGIVAATQERRPACRTG